MSPAAQALRPFVARQWRALAGAGGATAALTAADLAKPWPLALIVDRLLDGRTAPFALERADVRLLAVVAALVLAIALVESAAQYFADLRLQVAGERIAHELRVSVYDQLQRLSLGFHQRRQKGDLLTRVTSDVNAMGDLFAQSLGQITQAALLSAGMIAVLLWLDPVLALVAMATSPPLAAVSHVYRRRMRSQARERRTQDGRIASIAGEALSAMAIVKAFGSETHESARVRRGSEDRMAAGVEVARLQARFDGLVGAVRAVGTALVLVVGVLRVANGALSPGELIVFVSYTRKAHNPLRRMARETTKVAAAMARMERLAEILGADEVLEERRGAHRGGRATGELALEGVSFAYAAGRPALRDLTLRVPAGGSVAVMGPSGAGKSHARRPGRAPLRPHGGTGPDRRSRPARLCADVAARAGRDRAPGDRPVHRQRARQHRLRVARRARRRSRPPRERRPRTISSSPSRRATTRSSGLRAPASPAASASASASLARCCATRPCCCSTSPRPGSTRRARPSCWTGCAR